MDGKCSKLEGRVLDVPCVVYKSNEGEKKIVPYNGSWNMKEVKFFHGSEIKSWVLLNFANTEFCNEKALDKFVELFCKVASEQGIVMSRPSSVETVDYPQTTVESALLGAKENHHPDLILAILPRGSREIYSEVKKAAETAIDLVTQCILDKTVVKKCVPHTISNLCQKINAKMGGINHGILSSGLKPILKEPIIVIGASMTEPSLKLQFGFKTNISVAAVVANLDRHSSRYAATVTAQTSVDERPVQYIMDLENMVVKLLKAFYTHTKHKPKKIVFYREGVCQSQVDIVSKIEVMSVRSACKSLQAEGFEPGILYIVVQKGHSTRFRPQNERDGVGRTRNIRPGTTVDGPYINPLKVDFFLASHFATEGTPRPTHYTIVENDNQLSTDDIQELTFNLCHTSARSTSSVSRPVPVLYAHLATKRALRHLEAAGDEVQSLETLLVKIKVIEGLADKMYFV